MQNFKKYKYELRIAGLLAILATMILIIVIVTQIKNKPAISKSGDDTYSLYDDPNYLTGYDIAKLNTDKNISKSFDSGDFSRLNDIVNYRLSLNGKDVDAIIKKSLILSQEGSLRYREDELGTQAIVFANQAITIDPKNVDAWRSLGYANEIMGNYVEANKAYNQALIIDPKNSLVLFQKGHVYDLQGDLVNAEKYYQQSLLSDPTYTKALLGMGRIYVAKKEYTKALSVFKQVAHTSASARLSAGAYYSAGTVSGYLNQPNDELNFMQQAVNKDPTYDSAWVGLGTVLFNIAVSTSTNLTIDQKRGNAEDSFNALHKAIEINPKLFSAYYQLGTQLIIMGKQQDGITFLNMAKNVLPTDITLSQRDKNSNLILVNAALQVANKTQQSK